MQYFKLTSTEILFENRSFALVMKMKSLLLYTLFPILLQIWTRQMILNFTAYVIFWKLSDLTGKNKTKTVTIIVST